MSPDFHEFEPIGPYVPRPLEPDRTARGPFPDGRDLGLRWTPDPDGLEPWGAGPERDARRGER